MPLSDRERQILSDIEARLRQDDPRFARAVGTTTVSSRARGRLKLAVAGFVLGLLLLFGIVASFWFGVAGFALMLGSVLYGASMVKQMGRDQPSRLGGQLRGGFTRYLDDRQGREGDPRT